MAGEKERVDAYQDTVRRLEPDIGMIDNGAFNASAAISLKRIADAVEAIAMLVTIGAGAVLFYVVFGVVFRMIYGL